MAGVSSFKQDHHIVFGIGLLTVGVFGLIGSVTGSLAVMLAALFDPSALVDGSNSGGTALLPIVGKAGSDSGEDEGEGEPGEGDSNGSSPLGDIGEGLSDLAEL